MRAALKTHGGQIARFGFVGVLCAVTDFALFAGIVALGLVPPAAANVASFLVANVEGYFLNALVTFRRGGARPELSLTGYGRYLGAYLLSLVLSTVIVGALSGRIGPLAAKLVAIAVAAAMNYVAATFFVFRRSAGKESGSGESA